MIRARKRSRTRADGSTYTWWIVRVAMGERGRTREVTGSTKREAEDKARDLLKRGPDLTPSRRTVADAVRENSGKVEAGDRTVRRRVDAWERHAGTLAKVRLDKLTIARARDWRNGLDRSRDAEFAVEAVRIALDFEVGSTLPTNPFRNLPRRPRRRVTDEAGQGTRRVKVFSDDEARRLKDAARTHRHAGLLWVLFDCGLRPSEALGLKWGDLDAELNRLSVRRCVVDEGGRNVHISDVLKTENSRRDVPISDDTIRALGAPGPDDALVFPSAVGGPQGKRTLYRWWQELHHRAGVELVHGRSLHACRHTFASRLLDAGISNAKVAAVLGDTPRTVSLYYEHARRDGDEVVDLILGRASGGGTSRAPSGRRRP